jgi:hypothetical protein
MMTTTSRTESAPESDSSLWQLVCRGSESAFEVLVRRHQSLVCAVAYSACGNLALSEDVAQETFWTAWRTRATLEQPDRLRAWLCGIARNLAKDWGTETWLDFTHPHGSVRRRSPGPTGPGRGPASPRVRPVRASPARSQSHCTRWRSRPADRIGPNRTVTPAGGTGPKKHEAWSDPDRSGPLVTRGKVGVRHRGKSDADGLPDSRTASDHLPIVFDSDL